MILQRIYGPFLCAMAVAGSAAVAASPQAGKTHHVSAPSTGPVILTQQPGTALDKAARALNADDITHAQAKGDQPLVLIGSAPLAAKGGDVALFVQLQSANLCGSAGCSTSIYLRHGDDWHKILDSVSGPVVVLPQIHGGMHDLQVGDHDRWVWRGQAYEDTIPAAPIGNLRKSVEDHQAAMREQEKAAPDKATPASTGQ